MKKSSNKEIRVIDNEVKKQMEYLSRNYDNYFSDTLSLIMNFEPLRQKVVLDRPTRTLEHRIVLVQSGFSCFQIMSYEYKIRAGQLIIFPANSVISKTMQSYDYDVYSLSFRFPEMDERGLVGYEPLQMVLSDSDKRIVEGYFQLLYRLVSANQENLEVVKHLVISMLYEIGSIQKKNSRPVVKNRIGRPQEIQNEFVRLLYEQVYPVRMPEYYARKLGITKGYLSDVLRETTNRSVLDWINERTIQLAQVMLCSTDMMVKDVGEHLYFKDTSHFVRFFKKHVGLTPTEFCKQKK